MIFSLENIMILSRYISLIFIIAIFVPTLTILQHSSSFAMETIGYDGYGVDITRG